MPVGRAQRVLLDIFASNVDTDDWEIGEDLPGGAIRDYVRPRALRRSRARRRLRHPAPTTATRPTTTAPSSSSGIPNHAYYLIVQNIGRKDAEQVMYRVLTEELEPDSGFEDFRTAR